MGGICLSAHTGDQLLKPGEASQLLEVHRSTLVRWANTGVIPSIRTPGGHRRFREGDVLSLKTERKQQ